MGLHGPEMGATAEDLGTVQHPHPTLAENLMEAAEHLLGRRETDRVLIAISDGLPEGRRSTTEDLRRAVAALTRPPPEVELIGVGLGPRTGHVTALYPRSRADVPSARFAAEIGGVLEEVLVGPKMSDSSG